MVKTNSKYSAWLKAMRLRSLPLALASILMGSFLAADKGYFSISIFCLTLSTAALLQILSNLANDLGDFQNGADDENRLGPKRMVQSGDISPAQMKDAIWACGILSLISGTALIILSCQSVFQLVFFTVLGLLSLFAAIAYTMGKRPYGYSGLGDISVFLFFGWIGVLGSYFLQSQIWDWLLLLPASATSLFMVAVLNVNNIRDINSDKLAGKNTLAVRLGRRNAVLYHFSLLIVGVIFSLIYVFLHYENPGQLLFLMAIPFFYANAVAVKEKLDPQELDPYLKQMVLSTIIFVVCFGIGNLL